MTTENTKVIPKTDPFLLYNVDAARQQQQKEALCPQQLQLDALMAGGIHHFARKIGRCWPLPSASRHVSARGARHHESATFVPPNRETSARVERTIMSESK